MFLSKGAYLTREINIMLCGAWSFEGPPPPRPLILIRAREKTCLVASHATTFNPSDAK